ncbi:MAG: GNAT family N-acetyltransferase [Actinomycetota bacterium]|nr:GNAT family N-acetyltransferase [Actinomycetota bacterium]
MDTPAEIASVDGNNLAQRGFFCRKSKTKTEGNRRKIAWAGDGFESGLGIEILYEDGRSVGFVEYTPGEHAWRAVHAPGYLVIHCLWVVGRAKGKGYGAALLERVESKARDLGSVGVAMVTSSGVWLADNRLLLAHGYDSVDEAPPSFNLMVKSFNGAPEPSFPTDWVERAAAYGDGLTIVTTDQCPYLEDAEQAVLAGAEKLGLPVAIAKLHTAADVQARSPSAFGVFGVVLNGELLSYHYLLEKDLVALVSSRT